MIGIMGNEFFGKRMKNAFDGKIESEFFYTCLKDRNFKNKISEVGIIHFIGSPTVTIHGVLTLLRLKFWKKKVVVHWVGADSWLATNKTLPKIFTKILKNKIDQHIAIEEILSKRIENLGIKPKILPLPVATHYQICPLPKEKTILVYAPDKTDYYWKRFNGELIKKIVQEFDDVNFIIVRNSGKYFNEKNVSCFKWVEDMEEIYKKVLAVIRISTHDGQPGTIVEALSMGRQFIYSQKFPGCKTATNYNELKKALNEILQNPELNYEGAEYVEKEYSLEKIVSKLEKIYQNML